MELINQLKLNLKMSLEKASFKMQVSLIQSYFLTMKLTQISLNPYHHQAWLTSDWSGCESRSVLLGTLAHGVNQSTEAEFEKVFKKNTFVRKTYAFKTKAGELLKNVILLLQYSLFA